MKHSIPDQEIIEDISLSNDTFLLCCEVPKSLTYMHTAMEPWKRTIPTIILLLLGSLSTNVHAAITKTPSGGVFLEGSDVTLTCVVEGNDYVVWDDLSDATSIFIGKKKNNEKKKYDNFEISSVDGDFSLIIKDVQLSDEGTYVCKDQDRHATATVTIGVLPNVHLSVKQTEATQAPQTSTEVNITCSAYNARPAVSVFELNVIGSEKTVNITNDKSNQNEDGITYNSSASLPYVMSSEEMSVYCRVFTAGRSIKHTENFYKPRCNITMSGNEIRCLCQANPQVNTYYIDFNGNNHDGDVLFIEEDDPMNIRCFATNELGTGQSDLLFPDDIYGFGLIPVAVIVSIVVLLVVLTVIYIRYRCGPTEKKSDEEQPTVQVANEEESVKLISESEQIPPENEEMSDRKITNDEKASSISPNLDSSCAQTDLTSVSKDPQKFIRKILLQVNKDWEIFAIDILNISERVVKEVVMENNNLEDQINAATENMTYDHIEVLDKNAELWEKFGFEYVKGENGCFLQHITNTRAEKSSNDETICQQDPPTIESRVDMLKLCRERIGKVGIRRLLAALTKGDIETEDETNVLEKLDKDGVINIDCANLLSNLSYCKLFRARKIVCDYLEADLWNYITSDLCPQISLDWEIFAVEVLKLEIDHVLDIIEHTNDEKGQILSMFRKWRSIRGQQEKVSKPFLQDLIKDNELSGKIMSKDNRLKDDTALKVKPTNEGDCSKEFLAILTTCCKRIGVVGSKRFAEINSKGGLRKFLVGVVGTSAEAPEGISVDDSVDSLGQLCLMLSKANLFTARDVVIPYIEKKLHKVIATISKERASDWEKFAKYGLSLSGNDVAYIRRASQSNEARVSMAISKWMRKKKIDIDVLETLQRKALATFSGFE